MNPNKSEDPDPGFNKDRNTDPDSNHYRNPDPGFNQDRNSDPGSLLLPIYVSDSVI